MSEAIANLYDNGLDIGHIAVRLGIPRGEVAAAVDHMGDRGRARLMPLSAEQLWLASIYWRSGYDTMQIARKLKVPEAAVYNRRAEA